MIIVVGHSHYFRALFQRFLHADVEYSQPELAHRLLDELMPNCSLACCQLDFARGPRMITDVRPMIAVPTPSGGHNLVLQREYEQLRGPL